MMVGYSIRNIEVRLDMERVLGAPTKIAELPPGENIWRKFQLILMQADLMTLENAMPL